MGTSVRLNCGNGVWIEVEGGMIKEAFKEIADYQQAFGEKLCGQCRSTELAFDHRQDSDGHDYYAMRCTACGAQLSFGQKKTGGTLFAKRKDADGRWDNEHFGWFRWQDRKKGDHGTSNGSSHEEPEQFGEF